MSIPENADHKKFRHYDPDAPLPMPIFLRDWLPDGHLADVVSEVVDTLDLSEIYAHYDKTLRGQPPYDPRLMVKLLIYGYTVGIPSSRRIEKKTYGFCTETKKAISISRLREIPWARCV